MKNIILSLILLVSQLLLFSQLKEYLELYNARQERTEWFRDARFGMFIHWGIYAIPARGEWVRSIEEITVEEYQSSFESFDPKHYNPREWAKLAKEAGMKYAVITAKHHDGFCPRLVLW